MTSFALTDQAAFGFYLRQQSRPAQLKNAPAQPIAVQPTAALPMADATAPVLQPPTQHGFTLIAAAVVVALHLALPLLLAKTPLPVVAAKIPPMTVQLQKPAPTPQQVAKPVKPTPPKVEKQLETPKPLQKKLPPKPVEQVNAVPTTVPQPVAQPVAQPVSQPLAQPQVQPEPVFVAATAEPDYLQNPAPAYPETALENGWEGTVLLNVHVTGDGKADDVQIKNSSGRKILDNAAVATVAGWSFVPAKQGDQPVDSWVEVPIEFSLTNS
ncbi:energy transducer TonB [Rheinheimera texasensis]|uniref:energy transducer TonB n=1 Tax=Rheinheimera texasensis TaxID=306205 RepID=UPI0032B1DE71